MGAPQIWGTLSRAVNDSTTIDNAIATAVQAHDDDPEAHLEAGQSLTTHRAAEIIDHLAESVVNDKIAGIARAYKAIVGSGLEGDFDTLQAAIDYVAGVGGGSILITPGEYYLSGAVTFPSNINLYGVDVEAVIVHGGYTGGNYLQLVDDTVGGQIDQQVMNIHFVNDGGGVFYMPVNTGTFNRRMRYDFCSFTGGGPYVSSGYRKHYFDHCTFELNAIAAIQTCLWVELTYCTATTLAGAASAYLYSTDAVVGDVATVKIYNSSISMSNATNGYLVVPGDVEDFFAENTWFYGLNPTGMDNCFTHFINNHVSLKAATAITIGSNLYNPLFIGNSITGGATPNIIVASDYGVVTNNVFNGQPTITNTTSIVQNNAPFIPYKVAGSTDTAMAFGLRGVVQATPTANRTYTTTVPAAGERRSLIILTSGTSSYVITFSTGFKTTGTLTTGTTSARYFVIEFVSNGTYLIETRRTTAIA